MDLDSIKLIMEEEEPTGFFMDEQLVVVAHDIAVNQENKATSSWFGKKKKDDVKNAIPEYPTYIEDMVPEIEEKEENGAGKKDKKSGKVENDAEKNTKDEMKEVKVDDSKAKGMMDDEKIKKEYKMEDKEDIKKEDIKEDTQKIKESSKKNKEVVEYVFDQTDEERYQRKKMLASGMIDLALLAANSNELRHIVERPKHPFYFASLWLITASLCFQLMVMILILMHSSIHFPRESKNRGARANILNNFITAGVLVICCLNVFASTYRVPVSNTYSGTFPTELFF